MGLFNEYSNQQGIYSGVKEVAGIWTRVDSLQMLLIFYFLFFFRIILL